jgi:hypothetical protein
MNSTSSHKRTLTTNAKLTSLPSTMYTNKAVKVQCSNGSDPIYKKQKPAKLAQNRDSRCTIPDSQKTSKKATMNLLAVASLSCIPKLVRPICAVQRSPNLRPVQQDRPKLAMKQLRSKPWIMQMNLRISITQRMTSPEASSTKRLNCWRPTPSAGDLSRKNLYDVTVLMAPPSRLNVEGNVRSCLLKARPKYNDLRLAPVHGQPRPPRKALQGPKHSMEFRAALVEESRTKSSANKRQGTGTTANLGKSPSI